MSLTLLDDLIGRNVTLYFRQFGHTSQCLVRDSKTKKGILSISYMRLPSIFPPAMTDCKEYKELRTFVVGKYTLEDDKLKEGSKSFKLYCVEGKVKLNLRFVTGHRDEDLIVRSWGG